MPEDKFYKQSTLVDIITSNEVSPLEMPKQIGGYKIESLLNKGGMSLLYLGIHPETHEPITIKVLSSTFVSHPEMVGRFMKEAAIIELTNHPNIVKLYGHGKWEGGLYIAMEFIQGISLRQMILQQAMSLKRSLEIVLQIAHALAHLHAHGIIHRDLKPENILLTAQGGVKVIDFGISQVYSEKEEALPAGKRLVMGTPVYMSPEQREDPLNISFSTDIYALAIITYELVLGRLSHGIVHLSMMPKGLQTILAKALQPKPEDRYGDIIDFIRDISLYISSEEIQKEMRGSDYLSELNENLREAQKVIITRKLPQWPRLDIALSSNINSVVSGVYYDFFEQSDGVYSIIMGESTATGAEGLLHIAVLRGMVRALAFSQSSPIEIVSKLNRLLAKEPNEHTYTLNYLTLIPMQDSFSYISCGYGPLWHLPTGADSPRQIESDNLALGLDPNREILEMTSRWSIGDTLILHTFQASMKNQENSQDEVHFKEALLENLFLSPTKQADAIFRKVAKVDGNAIANRPVTVMSIQRLA